MTLNTQNTLPLPQYQTLLTKVKQNPTPLNVKPALNFCRAGETCTRLPDGRFIVTGGHIKGQALNDVCITDGNKQSWLGYPSHVLPPIYEHTATVLGNELWLIGSAHIDKTCLYQTPLYRINLNTYQIHKVASRNSMRQIYGHQTLLKSGQFVIMGGHIITSDTLGDVLIYDNLDDWTFNPKTLLFTKVKGRLQQLFIIGRKDGLDLTCQKFPDNLTIPPIPHTPHYDKQMTYDDRILNEIDIDISMSGAGVNSEQAQTVQVRYVAYPDAIHVYVLGKLPDDILDCLTQNLCHQLAKLERFGCGVWEIALT